MRVYSSTIVSFLRRQESLVRNILSQEAGIKVYRSRFVYKDMLYPINIVCFEDQRRAGELGYFKPEFFQIGINRVLMTAGEDAIGSVLRHELAHYLTYLRYGDQVQDHGKEYRQTCLELGWGEEVYSAKVSLEKIENLSKDNQDSKILSKIKKLLALGSSSSSHEAELATIKANQLLIKHNLESSSLSNDSDNEEEFCVLSVATSKRVDAKLYALYDILPSFLVSPVISRGNKEACLEVVGTRLNVELADYVAKFLLFEFERLWKSAKNKNLKLKGIAAKNNFLRGLAKGLIKKLSSSQKGSASSKALVPLKNSLEKGVQMIYPRMSGCSVEGKLCSDSLAAGEKAGESISIHPGLSQKSHDIRLLS